MFDRDDLQGWRRMCIIPQTGNRRVIYMVWQRIFILVSLLGLAACQSTVSKDWYQPSDAYQAKALDDYNQVVMRNLYDAYAFVPTTGIKVSFSGGDLIFKDKHYPYGTFDLVLSDGQCRTVSFHPLTSNPAQQGLAKADASIQSDDPQHITLNVCYQKEVLTMTPTNFDHPVVFYQVSRWHQGVDYHPISLGWPNRLHRAHIFVHTIFSNAPFTSS